MKFLLKWKTKEDKNVKNNELEFNVSFVDFDKSIVYSLVNSLFKSKDLIEIELRQNERIIFHKIKENLIKYSVQPFKDIDKKIHIKGPLDIYVDYDDVDQKFVEQELPLILEKLNS